MDTEDKFCHICGKELVFYEIDLFDTKTGEKIKKKKCPTNICLHYGIKHDYELSTKWERMIWKCKICGDTKIKWFEY